MYNTILSDLLAPRVEVETSNLSDFELAHFECDYRNETSDIESAASELSELLGEN